LEQQTYIPGFLLNQFVDVMWVSKSNVIDVEFTHHAPLFTELIFNYGDTLAVEGQNVEQESSKFYGQIISGLKTSPFTTAANGVYGAVGLLLKPHCYGLLHQKFGTPEMREIADFLYETVFLPQKAKFEAAEKPLIEFFKGYGLDLDLRKFEKHISAELMRNGALQDFNSSVSITQKAFIQKFKKRYFLTPSDYVRLKQVNYAMVLIQKYPKESLTEIGLEAGFYDQSHFIRVFKKNYGCTPKGFKKRQILGG